MNPNTPKVICGVCSGKGGFRTEKKDAFHYNWIDCPYCEGYGFVEDIETTEDECRDYLRYETYKHKIENELSILADVKVVSTETIGRDLYIRVVPYKRNSWVNLVKSMLKFAHYNENVNILPKQAFYYTDQDQHHIYWELNISINSLSDLDGLVELIKMYNATLEGDII